MKSQSEIDESSFHSMTRTRVWVIVATLVAMLLTMGLAYFIWKQLPELPIREVVFSGEIRHARTDQLHALALGMRGSLWRIDLAEVREAVRQVPWVREVTVQRRFPARLEIHVEEHQPFAYWEAEEPMLVNTFGEVFHAGFDTDSPSLPVLSGPPDSATEVVKKYGEFTRMLESTGRRPVAVRLSARRAWQVSLDNGAWLELGRNEQDSRLARLVRAWPKVTALQAANMHIDVRYANGFALRRIPRESLIKSHMAARSVFRDGLQGAVRSEWSTPFASTATQQTARKTSAHAGFDKNSPSSALCSLASYQRIRPASHALNLDYSCQNAAHGGPNQSFPGPRGFQQGLNS